MKYLKFFDSLSHSSSPHRVGLIEATFDRLDSYFQQKKISATTYQSTEIGSGSFDFISPKLIRNYDVCIIDVPSSDLYHKTSLIAEEARSISSCDDFKPVFRKYLKQAPTDVIFVLNIDIFDSIEVAISLLLDLRPQLPQAAFVICSSHFSKNDFSKQRMSIADTSLRLPCSSVALAIAIEGAIRNKRSVYG